MEMSVEIIEITNTALGTDLLWLCILLLVLLSIFVFTAGYKWRIIRKREKRIEELENKAVEKEELAKILNIQLN